MRDTLHLSIDQLATPIGDLHIVVDDNGNLRATFWTDREETIRRALERLYPLLHLEWNTARNPHGLTAALAAYFAGDVRVLDRIPVHFAGTPFQQTVWCALRDVPCGDTISYGELARRIGHPTAVRAVGLANGANPVGVVVPCHRVIGANGSLTGYGGGIERKRWLLDHERQLRF